MSERIDIEVELHGTEQVNDGFRQMGVSSKQMSTEMRQTARDVTIMGTAFMSLTHAAESFGLLNREQAKTLQGIGALITLSGTMIRVQEVLTRANLTAAASFATKTAATIVDTAAQWAHTIAQNARAVATAIANAVTNPLFLPVMLAAGTAAAAGISAVTPKMGDGGIVYGPTLAVIGEKGPEAVVPLNHAMGNVTINVYGGTVETVMQALRRSGLK